MNLEQKKRWLSKPLEELERKAKKARRKSIWTAEEIILAEKKAEELQKIFNFEN